VDSCIELLAAAADGPGSSVLERVPLAIVARNGRTALFAATIEPVPTGRQPAVTTVAAERSTKASK